MKKENKKNNQNQDINYKELDIELINVKKSYSRCTNDTQRLITLLLPFLKRERRVVLENINLKIYQGEKVAFIGKNGCGKSTILKIISKITIPDCGVVNVKRKVSVLLEVNTGFNQEFSAKENVITRATLLGIRKKEIMAKMKEIFEFAEVDYEMADQQIKRFSSGMIAKLGFAINIFCCPQILIIDEALAVGDISFKNKVEQTIKNLSKDNYITLLFVSHDQEMVEDMCSRGIYIKDGNIVFDGNVHDAFEKYNNDILKKKTNNKKQNKIKKKKK